MRPCTEEQGWIASCTVIAAMLVANALNPQATATENLWIPTLRIAGADLTWIGGHGAGRRKTRPGRPRRCAHTGAKACQLAEKP